VNADDHIDWRNWELHRILREQHLADIKVVPFFEATKDLAALHRGMHGGSSDCTHFCWTPTLWQPLWVSLARTVKDDAYVKGSELAIGSRVASTGNGDVGSFVPFLAFVMGCVLAVLAMNVLRQGRRK
jgi:hypothetical protein